MFKRLLSAPSCPQRHDKRRIFHFLSVILIFSVYVQSFETDVLSDGISRLFDFSSQVDELFFSAYFETFRKLIKSYKYWLHAGLDLS